MTISIQLEQADQPDIITLLEKSDAYMASLYPAESNHLLDVTTLMKPEVSFLVARKEGQIVGCCALVSQDDGFAEIKRMFVDPNARGLKIGQKLMDAIETLGRDLGLRAIRLETGISQPEAIGLYRKAGFEDVPAFAPYKPDPLSLFMQKTL
jgi:putative acetyltransferase